MFFSIVITKKVEVFEFPIEEFKMRFSFESKILKPVYPSTVEIHLQNFDWMFGTFAEKDQLWFVHPRGIKALSISY